MLQVIESYLSRFEGELEQISLIQSFPKRHGRQNAARQDAISNTLSQEAEEFEGNGLEFPDVIHVEGFNALKIWNGHIKSLPHLIFKKFKKQDLILKSENCEVD
jgi:hypothetical protein